MALIVSPGAPDAEAYWGIEEINAYAVARSKSFPITGSDGPSTAVAVAAAEAAARRGTAWLDGTYRCRFQGQPTDVWQALEWPRKGVVYREQELPDDAIPPQISRAAAEAAIRELAAPGSLSPDVTMADRVTREKVGELEVQYAEATGVSASRPVVTEIDAILAPLLRAAGGASIDLLRV